MVTRLISEGAGRWLPVVLVASWVGQAVEEIGVSMAVLIVGGWSDCDGRDAGWTDGVSGETRMDGEAASVHLSVEKLLNCSNGTHKVVG